MALDGLQLTRLQDQLLYHLKLTAGGQRGLCLSPARHTRAHDGMNGSVRRAANLVHDDTLPHPGPQATAEKMPQPLA